MRHAPTILLALALLALQPAPARGEADTAPVVVIAVIDSGTNLYHAEFRDLAFGGRAPSEIVRGFPADAIRFPLALDAPTWESAYAEDASRLADLDAGRLYWFPGTKIVGAMSFDFYGTPAGWPLILDQPGVSTHGSMTTSRAAGNTIGLAGAEVRLVVLQARSSEARAQAIQWAAFEPWIDIVSVSFSGPPSGVPTTRAFHESLATALEQSSQRKPTFVSAGNGLGNLGTVGFPTWARGMSGLPNVISVGAVDSEYVAQWSNHDPYVAADGCRVDDIDPGSLDAIVPQGAGTSAATPWVAGGAAKILLEARRALGDASVGPTGLVAPAAGWDSGSARDATTALATGGPVGSGALADGVLTVAELKGLLYRTALPLPTHDASDGGRCDIPPDATWVEVRHVPREARFPFIGWGEVNGASVASAVAALGDDTLPERAVDDAHYRRAHATKTAATLRVL